MKTLWAFEPFHQSNKQNADFFRTIKNLKFDKKSPEVHTGFVVTRTENELLLATDVPYQDRFTKLPRKYTKQSLKSAKIALPDKNIHIVDHSTFSTTEAVKALSQLAKKQKADVVALFTHANKGFKRFFLGSFAESAIHHIDAHLLIANPDTQFSKDIKNIIYACDFTEKSKAHVKQLIEICKYSKAHLSIYHAAEPYYRSTHKDLEKVVEKYRAEISKYEDFLDEACEKADITCSLYISSNFDKVATNLMKVAKKVKADLIVTSAKSGPVMALMGGSVTRQIIRLAKKPVLVLK